MQSDDVLRPLRHRGNLVDVERRGVGGENCPGFGDGVELGEDFLLQGHVLEDRLDDDVRRSQRRIIQRGRNESETLLALFRLEAAPCDRALVVLADGGQAAIEILLAGVKNDDLNARVGEAHADASAHGTGADDADLPDRPRLDVCPYPGNPAHFALGEEQVAQRAAFRCALHLDRQAALERDAVVEIPAHGRFDRVEKYVRRVAVAHGLGDLCPTCGDHLCDLFAAGDAAIARAPGSGSSGNQVASVCKRRVDQIAAGHDVSEPGVLGLRRGKRLAGQHHVERRFQADQPRHALSATGARDDAQREFRQAEARAFGSDTVVARDGGLQSAAHHGAVHGGDHRDRAVLDQSQHLVVSGILNPGLEFPHVAPGKEGLAGTRQDNRLHILVATQCLEGSLQPGADLARHGIHRRAVDAYNRDIASVCTAHCLGHSCSP